MMKKVTVYFVWMVMLLLSGAGLFAQKGEAGTESIFSIGAGARMLGMGNAAVAFPDDPSAMIWNPAGMVVVEQRGLGLSMITLFEGSQYHFLGYVHPMLNAGTLGLGISRIGTGDIGIRDDINDIPVDLGTMDYWWGKLTLAYGLSVVKHVSVGVALEFNRQVMGTEYATNGFGINAGVHILSPFNRGILSNVHLGAHLVNAVSPNLKLGESNESIPPVFQAGVAKVFYLRDRADRLVFLGDMETGEYISSRVRAGMEYGFNNQIFIRAGYDNGELTFGGGLRFKSFQLDYGTAFIGHADYFPRSHQFSLNIYLGRSVFERRQIQEENRRREVQQRFDARLREDRQRNINEALQAGKDYLIQGDYFNARLEFSRVLRIDSENEEAARLMKQTSDEERALQRQREEALLQQERDKEKQTRDIAFVNQKMAEAIEAMQNEDFQKAIEKWREALERDPENPQIQTYIRQAEETLESNVNEMIARANQLVRQENLSEAYRVLSKAKDQTMGNVVLQAKVTREIKKLDRIVDFITNYQEGIQRYGRGEYESAMRYLERALEIQPGHAKAKEFYQNARARTQGGGSQEMSASVKAKFNQGIRLYRDGLYEEALKVWEEALAEDPNNVRLLEAIAGVKEKISKYNKND